MEVNVFYKIFKKTLISLERTPLYAAIGCKLYIKRQISGFPASFRKESTILKNIFPMPFRKQLFDSQPDCILLDDNM